MSNPPKRPAASWGRPALPPLPLGAGGHSAASPGAAAPKPRPGEVSLSVDQLARPGAMVSGKVTFSDGNSADWYFDQSGQLGLVPQQPGYRPPPADLQQFQTALNEELTRMGF